MAVGGADAVQIADAAVAIWARVHAALAPLIGQRGSAALYKRSLHLARADYSWLVAAFGLFVGGLVLLRKSAPQGAE